MINFIPQANHNNENVIDAKQIQQFDPTLLSMDLGATILDYLQMAYKLSQAEAPTSNVPPVPIHKPGTRVIKHRIPRRRRRPTVKSRCCPPNNGESIQVRLKF